MAGKNMPMYATGQRRGQNERVMFNHAHHSFVLENLREKKYTTQGKHFKSESRGGPL